MHPGSNLDVVVLPCALGIVLQHENLFPNYTVFKSACSETPAAPAADAFQVLILFEETNLN